MKKITAFLGAALSLVVAFPVAAATNVYQYDTGANSATHVNVTGGTSADVHINVTGSSTSSNGQTTGGTHTTVTTETDGEATVTSSGSNTNASGNAMETTVIETPILILRADVDAGSVAATSVSSASVSSDSDLRGYIAAQMKQDSNITAVESASDKVSVTYKQEAKFLGFIPTSINAVADVNADGKVDVSYPWYSFLFSIPGKADVETDLQAAVNAALGASVSSNGSADASASANATAEASARLSAQAQALAIEAIRAAMATEVSANANASANGSASVQ